MEIEEASKASLRNRAAIKAADRASCYQCCRTFGAELVIEWVDGGETATCPHCDIDAVVPGEMTAEWLAAANARWFTGPADQP